MKNFIYIISILILLININAFAAIEKTDVMSGIKSGKIDISMSSDFDYGLLNNIFDGNPNTYATFKRGDTFAITLEFFYATPLVKSKLFTKSLNANWTFEAAGSMFELNYQQGEYIKSADKKAINQNVWDSIEFEERNYYVCKLTLEADSGDVTINEWELFSNMEILEINLSPKQIEIYPTWQKSLKLFITTNIGTFQMKIDESSLISNDDEIVRILTNNLLVGVAPGETEIIVNFSGFIDTCKVTVKEGKRSSEPGDLAVQFIKRLPTMNFVWGSENPKVDGWPLIGQEINWLASIKNFSKIDRFNVPYRWFLNDELLFSGTVDIPAFSTTEVLLSDNWTEQRQVIKFVLDPANTIDEEEKANNQIEIISDALSVGFYVEESVYNYFRENQHLLGVGSNCWEDWAKRHLNLWNEMFENAIYPETPNGVLDRLRLDNITLVPDSTLPIAGGYSTNTPNLFDRTVDLIWGFPAEMNISEYYGDLYSVSMENPFYFEGSLLHELGHARYLIDIYGFNVHDDGNGNTIAIKENDEMIVGTKYMPFLAWDAVHYTPIKGLMNSQFTFIDEYSAKALNLIEHHRATYGNYNAPGNIGAFINDIPTQNCLIIKDSLGNILDNAEIRIYRAEPQHNVWYGKFFDNQPDTIFVTDEFGRINSGNILFNAEVHIKHTYGWSNGTIILRAEHNGKVGYTFFESTLCNLKYWQGNTEFAEYEIMFPLFDISSVESNEVETSHFLSPNPAENSSILYFYTNNLNNCKIKIFDEFGKIIDKYDYNPTNIGKQRFLLNFNQYSSGNYFYTIQNEKTNLFGKFIILK